MIVPAPFTRALFLYGEPISIGRDEDVEQARRRVEEALNQLDDRAERDFESLWKGNSTT